MLAVLVDHLWQSILFTIVAWLLAIMLRTNATGLRLWLWRIAALKFLLPFALLYMLGAWLGFPVRHSALPPPAFLVDATASWLSLWAPAQTRRLATIWLVVGMVPALPGAAACCWWIGKELRRAQRQHAEDEARRAIDWEYRRPGLGPFQTVTLTLAAIWVPLAPVVMGAVENRLWRQEMLAADTTALRTAPVTMVEAAPGMGSTTRVVAHADSVSIRNISMKDLIALVYGVGRFEIFGGALPWLEWPRYDVRVSGRVRAPEAFDAYSLRQPVTELLSRRFGVTIRVNAQCQEPCGRREQISIDRR